MLNAEITLFERPASKKCLLKIETQNGSILRGSMSNLDGTVDIAVGERNIAESAEAAGEMRALYSSLGKLANDRSAFKITTDLSIDGELDAIIEEFGIQGLYAEGIDEYSDAVILGIHLPKAK